MKINYLIYIFFSIGLSSIFNYSSASIMDSHGKESNCNWEKAQFESTVKNDNYSNSAKYCIDKNNQVFFLLDKESISLVGFIDKITLDDSLLSTIVRNHSLVDLIGLGPFYKSEFRIEEYEGWTGKSYELIKYGCRSKEDCKNRIIERKEVGWEYMNLYKDFISNDKQIEKKEEVSNYEEYSKTASGLINNANNDANFGDYEMALSKYTKAIEISTNPNVKTGAYYNRAITKVSKKDYKGAIEDLSKAIKIQSPAIKTQSSAIKTVSNENLLKNMNSALSRQYQFRGKLRIVIGDKVSGCLDYKKANELGNKKAKKWLKSKKNSWCNDISIYKTP